MIINILETQPFIKLYEKDNNGRVINIFKMEKVSPYGDTFYPNLLFIDSSSLTLNTYKEKVMSLSSVDFSSAMSQSQNEVKYFNKYPLFFFIYNTDNYYHFVYDSLPYLISYLDLRKRIPGLKLLMNYPNFSKNKFYNFVNEFLELLDIGLDDVVIVDKNTLYEEIYVSNSYTHDIDSNLPPRKEIYRFYKKIVEIAKSKSDIDISALPKKIYISRRSWIHGDISNMGTNYTTKRSMKCEDELVEFLISKDFTEVFTENLSTIEKVIMFDNAELAVGSIGGGLCNALFSSDRLNLICIVSPTFLEVNSRFRYCFDNVNCFYFDETFHTEIGKWKKWMRVKTNNIIGEVEEIENEYLTISYTDNLLAGWNSEIEYKKIKVNKDLCESLDNGLNSSWSFNLDYFLHKFFTN